LTGQGLSREAEGRKLMWATTSLITNKNLARRLDELEEKYDTQFKVVFDAIRELMAPPRPRGRRIGFRVEEARLAYGRSRRVRRRAVTR